MVLRLEIELVRLTVVAQGLVVLLAAGLEVRVGQVGQGEHQGVVLRLDVAELGRVVGNGLLQLSHTLHDRGNVLAGLLQLRNLLGDLVLLGLLVLGVKNQLTALLVQLQNAVHFLVAVHFLGPQPGLDRSGIVFDAFDIQHN